MMDVGRAERDGPAHRLHPETKERSTERSGMTERCLNRETRLVSRAGDAMCTSRLETWGSASTTRFQLKWTSKPGRMPDRANDAEEDGRSNGTDRLRQEKGADGDPLDLESSRSKARENELDPSGIGRVLARVRSLSPWRGCFHAANGQSRPGSRARAKRALLGPGPNVSRFRHDSRFQSRNARGIHW